MTDDEIATEHRRIEALLLEVTGSTCRHVRIEHYTDDAGRARHRSNGKGRAVKLIATAPDGLPLVSGEWEWSLDDPKAGRLAVADALGKIPRLIEAWDARRARLKRQHRRSLAHTRSGEDHLAWRGRS